MCSNRLPIRPSPRIALDVDHYTSLIQTKLYRPRMGSDLIPRPRLLERLNAGLGGKVTLVCAPAGFGKTTLLVAWGETIDRPTAWLSLDEHDDELASFVRSLTAALQSVFPDAFGAMASLLQATRLPALDSLVALFSNDLADVPEDLLLVLDDYHRIRTSEVHSLLEQLVEHLPAQVHLVLSSRTDPQLPLARWQAQGYLHELRGSDLRFTLEETEAFLAYALGSVAAHEVAGALEERTEGWIAMVRLAALSLRNAPDQTAFLERLGHAPERTISRYLVEEVLSQQAPAVQEFVVRMSMVEQFCTGLCRAIMGSDASNEQMQATLEWLERSNLFLVPLDERQGWYRFHHLFQGLLQQRLQERLSQEEIALLHRRASAWYAEQGLIEKALEHALRGEMRRVRHGWWKRIFLGHSSRRSGFRLERWIRLLPEEQIQGSPVLLFALAWIVQARGQLTDLPPLLTAAEQLLETKDKGASESGTSQTSILRALIRFLWSEFQYFTGQPQASWQSARSALEWIPPGEEYLANLALLFLTLPGLTNGQEEVVLARLQQALRDHSANLQGTARLLFAQELLYLDAGKLHQAEHTARHLLQIAQEGDLALSQNYAHWLLGVAHYEWDKLDAAVYHFSAVLANQHLAHFLVVRDSMCGLALAYQAKGLGTEAQETARALLAMMQEQRNMGGMMAAYAFLGRLALLQGEVEEASRWLELAGVQKVWGSMLFWRINLSPKCVCCLPKVTLPVWLMGKHSSPTSCTMSKTCTLPARRSRCLLCKRGPTICKVVRLRRSRCWNKRLLWGVLVGSSAPLPICRRWPQCCRRCANAGRHKSSRQQLDTYLHRLQVAMSSLASPPRSTEELLKQEGLEPLTERELHILRLLERNLTNKEIARELVVTPGTVKVHTTNVYRKLSVNNRHAAVTLARSLGLLAAK